MVISSHPQTTTFPQPLTFLRQHLGLSDNALNLSLRQAKLEQAPLPIILWSFGLLSLSQYEQALD